MSSGRPLNPEASSFDWKCLFVPKKNPPKTKSRSDIVMRMRLTYCWNWFGSEIEVDIEDLLSNPFNTQPPSLDHLQQLTGFDRRWLMFMYRNFKQVTSKRLLRLLTTDLELTGYSEVLQRSYDAQWVALDISVTVSLRGQPSVCRPIVHGDFECPRPSSHHVRGNFVIFKAPLSGRYAIFTSNWSLF